MVTIKLSSRIIFNIPKCIINVAVINIDYTNFQFFNGLISKLYIKILRKWKFTEHRRMHARELKHEKESRQTP